MGLLFESKGNIDLWTVDCFCSGVWGGQGFSGTASYKHNLFRMWTQSPVLIMPGLRKDTWPFNSATNLPTSCHTERKKKSSHMLFQPSPDLKNFGVHVKCSRMARPLLITSRELVNFALKTCKYSLNCGEMTKLPTLGTETNRGLKMLVTFRLDLYFWTCLGCHWFTFHRGERTREIGLINLKYLCNLRIVGLEQFLY